MAILENINAYLPHGDFYLLSHCTSEGKFLKCNPFKDLFSKFKKNSGSWGAGILFWSCALEKRFLQGRASWG